MKRRKYTSACIEFSFYAGNRHHVTMTVEKGVFWEAGSSSCSSESVCVYGTRTFITLFTRYHYCYVSWEKWIHFSE